MINNPYLYWHSEGTLYKCAANCKQLVAIFTTEFKMTKESAALFLEELTQLTLKHKIYIEGPQYEEPWLCDLEDHLADCKYSITIPNKPEDGFIVFE